MCMLAVYKSASRDPLAYTAQPEREAEARTEAAAYIGQHFYYAKKSLQCCWFFNVRLVIRFNTVLQKRTGKNRKKRLIFYFNLDQATRDESLMIWSSELMMVEGGKEKLGSEGVVSHHLKSWISPEIRHRAAAAHSLSDSVLCWYLSVTLSELRWLILCIGEYLILYMYCMHCTVWAYSSQLIPDTPSCRFSSSHLHKAT